MVPAIIRRWLVSLSLAINRIIETIRALLLRFSTIRAPPLRFGTIRALLLLVIDGVIKAIRALLLLVIDGVIKAIRAPLLWFGIKLTSKWEVGIFSRDETHQWLQDVLQSETLLIRTVRSCYISNSDQTWRTEDIPRCDFAILYHTKRRGRVNITDVTDSLYDEELKELSERLGKENVVVLVDDLDTSGLEDKERIFQNQPSIKENARDLILVSAAEKDANMAASLRKKLRHMLEIMDRRSEFFYIIVRDNSWARFVHFLTKPFTFPLRITSRVLHLPSLGYGRVQLTEHPGRP